jgi:hypothetical protein
LVDFAYQAVKIRHPPTALASRPLEPARAEPAPMPSLPNQRAMRPGASSDWSILPIRP